MLVILYKIDEVSFDFKWISRNKQRMKALKLRACVAVRTSNVKLSRRTCSTIIFSSLNQLNHWFVALSLALTSSFLKLPSIMIVLPNLSELVDRIDQSTNETHQFCRTENCELLLVKPTLLLNNHHFGASQLSQFDRTDSSHLHTDRLGLQIWQVVGAQRGNSTTS